MKLRLAAGLSLPTEAVTQTIGILAKRRAGKSYTARLLVEQLVAAGLQVVIIDPKGDWWGIRAAADGKGAGLPITILGGERGDVPLEKSGGELVAKLVVEERVSALLDLSLFRKGDVAVFMTGFLEALYRIKAREIYRTPVMLVIDEADAIAPQKPQKGEERMLGAAEDIVRRGGQRGIGCTLITQRSAVLNKNVLTQVQILIALRTIAPQDLKAMDAWIDVHGTEEERRTLMASLPALPVGDAWVWSPGWPTSDGIFERVHVLPIDTFDSGETPKPGQKGAEPKTLADVDLEALPRQMADVVKRAEESDPRALRARVAALERELAAAGRAPASILRPDPAAVEMAKEAARIEVRRLHEKQLSKVVASAEAGRGRAARAIDQALEHLKRAADALREPIDVPEVEGAAVTPSTTPQVALSHALAPARQVAPRHAVVHDGAPLGKGEWICLVAIAQHDGGVSRDQLSILTGYKRSTRNTYVQRLGAAGLVDDGEIITATQAGVDALGADFEPLPTGDALREYWLAQLPEGERRCLEVVVEAGGELVDREVIGVETGYKRSTRNTYLQRLGARKLIVSEGAGVRAAAELFDR